MIAIGFICFLGGFLIACGIFGGAEKDAVKRGWMSVNSKLYKLTEFQP